MIPKPGGNGKRPLGRTVRRYGRVQDDASTRGAGRITVLWRSGHACGAVRFSGGGNQPLRKGVDRCRGSAKVCLLARTFLRNAHPGKITWKGAPKNRGGFRAFGADKDSVNTFV